MFRHPLQASLTSDLQLCRSSLQLPVCAPADVLLFVCVCVCWSSDWTAVFKTDGHLLGNKTPTAAATFFHSVSATFTEIWCFKVKVWHWVGFTFYIYELFLKSCLKQSCLLKQVDIFSDKQEGIELLLGNILFSIQVKSFKHSEVVRKL